MKKPKKSAAAKPRARRSTSSGTTPRAKSAITPGSEPAEPSKKAPVKRVKKAAAHAAEIAPQTEPGRPGEAKTPIQTEPPAKLKPSKIKGPSKPKIPVEVTSPPKAKPESLAGLIAEARSEPATSLTTSEAKQAVRATRKAPARIPPILLEGDKPSPTPASGPGQRFALGPTAPVEKLPTEGELPESYETGEVLLTARDPHWLYTHWDLSDDQQRRYNAFSRDGHLVVRVYIDAPGGKPAAEVHVHPESRHWFIHVERSNTRYVAELGYYSAADKWTVVSTSATTLTPPDAVSTDTSAEFTAIPFEVPMEKLLSLVKEVVHESAPLAKALQELRADGHPELPQIKTPEAGERPRETAAPASQPVSKWKPSEWTPAQERALAAVVSMDHVRRVWMGSLEITELIRRQFVHELVSRAAAELGAPLPGAPTSPAEAITGISSPAGEAARPQKGFWFNVNAELIVYGATEKDATVTIGGRKIKLRADGSFSYRFALPDGRYEMPVVAISADETDGRAAEMKFSRSTEYRGHVGAHPQDPSLQQLLLENF